jgi:hypothetical protein
VELRLALEKAVESKVPGAREIGLLVCFALCAFSFLRRVVIDAARDPLRIVYSCRATASVAKCKRSRRCACPTIVQRISLFERERSSTSDGFPAIICRRLPKLSFLGAWFPDSFPCKNSCRSVAKNFLRPCFIRANPCSSVALYRRVIRLAYCVMRFASARLGEGLR